MHQSNKKILLLLSERMGDVIFCTPAIHLLKTQRPNSIINAITPSNAAAQVLAHNPAVNNVFINPSDAAIKAMAREYGLILDLHNNRITEKWRQLLLIEETYINPRKGEIHQSEVATQFMARILQVPPEQALRQYQLFPQPTHQQNVQKMLNEHHIDPSQHILIGCHMGSHTTTRRGWKFWKPLTGDKCWPIAAFGEVMTAIHQQNPRVRFVLTGTPAEAQLSNKLKNYYDQAIDLVGKTSVLDLAGLIASCKVFLTGDTGPMHVATAMNVPVIGLFGPTNPLHTGPYPLASQHVILKADSLPDIAPRDVINAFKAFM